MNTSTRKKELLYTLPWDARCLYAAHGWLCVGGQDHGQFATVKLGDDGNGDEVFRTYSEVDAMLPLSLDPELRRQTHRSLVTREQRRPAAHTHELGQMIVNSVTIHRSADGDIGADDGTVAVLTNNDKTVTMYSLSHDRLLAALDFPFAMNHASISPRGDLLVAVGDEPIVYFYRKTQWNGLSYQWEMCAGSPLSPAMDPHVVSDGCFATAFSPSGHLCAVASQCGVITVFATQYVDQGEHEAIVKIMPSSRPRSDAGAVRAMCFAPEPMDMLICVEQNGRVCVLDVRDQFASRQVLSLSTTGDAVDRIEVDLAADFGVEAVIDPRLRESGDSEFIRQYRQTIAAQDEAAAVHFAADYLEASSERRRMQGQAREESPQPLTERERQILEALRSSRERLSAREQQQWPTSINYTQDASRASVTNSASAPVAPPSRGSSASTASPGQAERRHLPLAWNQGQPSLAGLHPRPQL